jgi:ArsR family transcriptional regulator
MSISAETLFSALANPIRLRCLLLLDTQGELCVCELTHALGLSQPMISRHLALLRQAGLVVDRRAGVWIYYAVNPVLPDWARSVLAETAGGLQQQAPFRHDLANLTSMPNRPGAQCCA